MMLVQSPASHKLGIVVYMCNLKPHYVEAGRSEVQGIWGCRGDPTHTSTLSSSLILANLLWPSQCELCSQGDGFFLHIVLRIFHYMFVYGCPSLGVYVACFMCVCVYTACIVCMVCVCACVCKHVVWVWELNFTAVSRDVYSAFEAHSDPPELILYLSLSGCALACTPSPHPARHIPHPQPFHLLFWCACGILAAFVFLQPGQFFSQVSA